MKRENIITPETIHAYLSDNAGHRFQAKHIAAVFGVSALSIRTSLDELVRQEKILKATGGKHGSLFFVRGAKEAEQAAKRVAVSFREWKPDPIYMQRVRESQDQRARFPSKFD